MPFLVLHPEIPYSESKSVIIFLQKYIFFISRKFSKSVASGHRHKMTKIKATSKETRSLLLKELRDFKFINVRLQQILYKTLTMNSKHWLQQILYETLTMNCKHRLQQILYKTLTMNSKHRLRQNLYKTLR